MTTQSGFFHVVVLSILRFHLSTDFRGSLRRFKPEKHNTPPRRRSDSELEFIETTSARPAKLLYDTTVYIDILQNRFPRQGELMLRAVDVWHSPVTEAELAAACGLLNPTHAQTHRVIEEIADVLDRRPIQRTITPDRDTWREAGIFSGMLARLQGLNKDQRLRVLNDALLYVSARRHGCTVLTRNLSDFDLLQQLDPSGRVLFYRLS